MYHYVVSLSILNFLLMTMMIMTIITLYSVIWVHHYPTFSTGVPNPNNPFPALGAQVTLRHLKNHIVAHSDLGLSYEERGGARNLN